MGYVAVQEGKYDEAHKSCEEAVELDPNDFTAHFCSAASLLRKGTQSPATLAQMENDFRAVIRVNPNFSPGYDGLATVMGIRGKNLTEA
jgi:Tfp pilus assembly protein PilF